MKIYICGFLVFIVLFLSSCLDQQNTSSSQNISPDKLSAEDVKQRQQQVFKNASEEPKQFRENLKENCPHFNFILLTTAETIQLGTRVFNAGGLSLTNRIYEGTIYKILYTIQDKCMDLSDTLQAGLAMAEAKDNYHDKAWALRDTLDLIMGGPPAKPPGGNY